MWAKKIMAALGCLALLLASAVCAEAGRVGASRSAFVPARGGAAAQRRSRRTSRKRMKKQTGGNRVQEGVWGGLHVRLNVRGDGADVEFDCAHGSLGGPLALDSEGRFDIAGTYTPEGHGPIRVGREPRARAARYTGRVDGGAMTLAVKFADGGQALEPLTLTRGSEGRVMKCR